ncbi:MAG: hypothetical protein ACYCXG_06685 [Acidiferrobacter sp.]
MSAFNHRLAPPRVLGFPLPAAIAGVIAVSALLVAVMAPWPWTGLPGGVAMLALPGGLWIMRWGDDYVFWPAIVASYREQRRIAAEAIWV